MALLFALAPDGVCQAATLPPRWCALTAPFQLFSCFARAVLGTFRAGESSFLWHCPSGRPAQPLAGILPCGARTFLAPETGYATVWLARLWYCSRKERQLSKGIRVTTYALVGASDFNGARFAVRDAAGVFDAVIAVDGGFASLAVLGRVPDLAMGDFDSLGYVPEGVEALAFPAEKDASDMELALEEAFSRGADAVEVYGALGGRLDHTLANLQLLAAFAERGLAVEAVGAAERISFLVGPGELCLPTASAGVVSVFSLTDVSTGVVEEGLKYGLDGVALTNRTSWGLSNEFVGTSARVALDSGTLAVLLPL